MNRDEQSDLEGAAGVPWAALIGEQDEDGQASTRPAPVRTWEDPEIPAVVRKYLKSDEDEIITTRYHWIRTLVPAIVLNGGLLAAITVTAWAYAAGQARPALVHTVWIVVLAGALWALWKYAEWRLTWFVATGHRVFLVQARHLLGVRVTQLPASRIRDLALEQTTVGRMLGYGTLDFASIGTEGALDRVDYLPDPEWLYQQINDLIMPAADRGIIKNRQGRG